MNVESRRKEKANQLNLHSNSIDRRGWLQMKQRHCLVSRGALRPRNVGHSPLEQPPEMFRFTELDRPVFFWIFIILGVDGFRLDHILSQKCAGSLSTLGFVEV